MRFILTHSVVLLASLAREACLGEAIRAVGGSDCRALRNEMALLTHCTPCELYLGVLGAATHIWKTDTIRGEGELTDMPSEPSCPFMNRHANTH